MKKISILHTGGTVASKVDYTTGAVIAKFTAEELLKLFPEMKKYAKIESRLVRNMQSEMMRFAHYNILAKAVKEEVEKGAEGIIITHGTDLLHYTSAALAFALENVKIPVLLVGSQRSSDRPSTDASLNLTGAARFIAETDFIGVAICMHENTNDENLIILPATKTKKFHTSRRDAFKPVNAKPIAIITPKKIEMKTKIEKSLGRFELKLFNEELKIGLFEPHPQMYAEELETYVGFDGLVLELFGIGHMPTMKVDEFTGENEQILKTIKSLAEKMPVVVSPQTIFGRIDMNVYTPGKQLLEAGVIGNYTDMHPETAFIKLAWLLSNHKDNVKELFSKNLRGEISARTEHSKNEL